MNVYDISLYMTVTTDDTREQNIALERINYYLGSCLGNCIFINENEKKVIEKYVTAGFNVCTFPFEPYDQLVTVMLLTKLHAIVEGRFDITDITLSSRLSDGVSYLHDSESPAGPFEEPGWWSKSDASITTRSKLTKKEKIVQFAARADDWAEIGLLWKEKPTVSEKIEIAFTTDSVK